MMVTEKSFKLYRHIVSFLLILVLTGCDKDEDINIKADYYQEYLQGMINVMKANSVNRKTIDWENFEEQVFKKASGAKTIEEVYPAIELALTLLGEQHSTYITKHKEILWVPGAGCRRTYPVDVPKDDEIGYVKIDAFIGVNESLVVERVQAIHDSIKAIDNENIKGWIVDLRGNNGGNMWPMLMSVGPILGNGIAGYFIDTYDKMVSWSYDNGRATTYNETENKPGYTAPFIPRPYIMKNITRKVAVLVDRTVASSGEIIFISFKERPNTRSFGTASCGVSTEVRSFNFIDGAVLRLASATFADRTKRKYGKAVMPDEVLPDEEAVLRAIEWIKE